MALTRSTETDFNVKKTARGEWYWGQIEAGKKPTPGKPAKASGKAAKAPRATKAKSPPASKSPSGKRADVLAAAQRGEIPAAPDFSAGGLRCGAVAPRVGLSGPRARRFQDEEWRLRKLSPESSMR